MSEWITVGHEVSLTLLWCVLQVSAVCLFGGVCCVLLKPFGPRAAACVTAWCFAVILVLSGLAFSPAPAWFGDPRAAEETTEAASAPMHARGLPAAGESAHDKTLPGRAATADSGDTVSTSSQSSWMSLALTFVREFQRAPVPQQANAQRRDVPAAAGWSWPMLCAALVLLGTGLGMTRFVLSLLALRAYRRESVMLDDAQLVQEVDVVRAELSRSCRVPTVTVSESAQLSTAATIGVWQATVVLPADWRDWSSEQRRAVLSHELAHVAHRDVPAWLVAQLCLAVHFCNPLIHWLANQLRLHQELAADAAAADVSGGRQPYLLTLAELALSDPPRSRQPSTMVALLARTYLPTRRTLLRRIEMLRDSQRRWTAQLHAGARIALSGLVLLAGVLAAGLRSDGQVPRANGSAPDNLQSENAFGNLAQGNSQAVPSDQADGVREVPIDVSVVLNDALAFLAMRPAQVLARPAAAQAAQMFRTMLAEDMTRTLGAPASEIAQLTVILTSKDGRRPNDPLLVVQTVSEHDFTQVPGLLDDAEEQQSILGRSLYLRRQTIPRWVGVVDSRTLVITDDEELVQRGVRWLLLDVTAQHLQAYAGKDVDVMAMTSTEPIRSEMARSPRKQASTRAFRALWSEPEKYVVTANVGEKLQVTLEAICPEDADVELVEKTMDFLATLGRDAVRDLERPGEQPVPGTPAAAFANDPALKMLSAFYRPMLDNLRIERDENLVRVTTEGNANVSMQMALLLPAVQQARQAARRTQSMNNLKQIMIAMHNYYDQHGCIPPPVLMGKNNQGGEHGHSWRIALLPYLEQAELYEQYRFDEPWNSPHNRQLTAQVPDVFRSPHSDSKTNASYFVLVGPDTAFPGGKGLDFLKITDGMSNTIAVVEARRDIHWAEPKDIPYTSAEQLELGGFTPGLFPAGFCDGSVRTISQNVDEQTLEWLIQINDGNPIPQF